LNAKLSSYLRLKLIFTIILSMILSVGIVVAIVITAAFLRNGFVRSLYDLINSTVGMTVAVSGTALILFLLLVLILTNNQIRYFNEMSRVVQGIANDQMGRRVPVRYDNELGTLATNINQVIDKLQTAIKEERLSEQSKNELVTNVSHDLRTPLTSIIGYLGLIEQDLYRDEVELRHYIHIAYEKAGRLRTEIEDLFEYTRERGSGLKLLKTPINIGELLKQLAHQYKLELQQADMELRLHLNEEKLITSADGNKMVRVFENLITNAMHYGREGKFIDVHVRREASQIVISVVNYGEAIPGIDLPYIFERFYRVEKSRAEHTGGTGLGLAISKSIVERHDGTIAAQSTESYTSFEVRLPIVTS
jgi:signal transduction histidine kinase